MNVPKKADQAQTTVFQAAVLPWRDSTALEIMLITSLDTRRWVLPKGGLMPNESPRSEAEREALEEAGLEGLVADHELGSYFYHKRSLIGVPQLCSVAVFPMKVLSQRKNWPEKKHRATKWFSIAEAAAVVHEKQLRDLLLTFGPGQ